MQIMPAYAYRVKHLIYHRHEETRLSQKPAYRSRHRE
jgi:hypothetical protein